MIIKTNMSDVRWKLGDVIVNEMDNNIALIVKDNDGKYCVMDIDSSATSDRTYSTDAVFTGDDISKFDSLGALKGAFDRDGWRKAQATLVTNSNVLLEGDYRED